jgi:hypothetical protein
MAGSTPNSSVVKPIANEGRHTLHDKRTKTIRNPNWRSSGRCWFSTGTNELARRLLPVLQIVSCAVANFGSCRNKAGFYKLDFGGAVVRDAPTLETKGAGQCCPSYFDIVTHFEGKVSALQML